jgi:predicted transcriptional regulator
MVNKQLLLPAEIQTYYIIPTLRKHLAQELRNHGLSVDKIASIFSCNKSAISQYIHNKRGNKISLTPKTLQLIKKTAPKVVDSLSYINEMQTFLNQTEKTTYTIHHQIAKLKINCQPKKNANN